MPTGGVPAPAPTGGFPGAAPPSTFATKTRGPKPTAFPGAPGMPGAGQGAGNGKGDGQGWLEFLEGMFGGKNGQGQAQD
jgi:hypothetical protein